MNKKDDQHACGIYRKTFPNRDLVAGAAVRDVVAEGRGPFLLSHFRDDIAA